MTDFNRNGMLFSSGDSPNSSAILSGDGLDEETRKVAVIVAVALLCGSQQMNKFASAKFLSFTFLPILLRALNHSNDALPLPYQVTLVRF